MCPADLRGGLGASPTPGGLSRFSRQLDQFLSPWTTGPHLPEGLTVCNWDPLGHSSRGAGQEGLTPLMILMPQATSHSLGEGVG